MTLLLPACTPQTAAAACIGATLKVIVGDAHKRVRRSITLRLLLVKALIAALWQRLLDLMQPFVFGLGEWVQTPVRRPRTLLAKRRDVEPKIPRQIARRFHHGNKNYYTMVGFPESFREDELTQYQKVLDFSNTRRVTVAA